MTWVIGASSIHGHGLMISDVRITFSDGTEADLLRKAYPIAPYMLAGFAGSVSIGLGLIDSLERFLHVPELPEDVAWQPEWVADKWSPIAAKLYEAAPLEERRCGSQILLVGVSPNEDLGVPVFKRVHVIKMNWPDFAPIYMPKGMSVSHIGSGSDVVDYEAAIANFFEHGSSAMMASLMSGPSGWSQMIAQSVATLVSENPVSGISPHVFVDTIALGAFWTGTNDRNTYHPDGRRVEFRMPLVAKNLSEFTMLCKKIGKAAATAVA